MNITNVRYYHNLPFEDYLALPGISYSGIKGFSGPPNAGMSLGTKVHAYLLEPAQYSWDNIDQVKAIAAVIRPILGPALAVLDKEVAFTCDMEYNGMVLHYKGRADLLKAGRIVVDLKVLAGAIAPAVSRFGYQDQISGYCLATGSPLGLIVAYNKGKKMGEMARIVPNIEFWQYQVCYRGVPANQLLQQHY